MGHLIYWVQIEYCNFKFIPGLGVVQRISDSSKCAPGHFICVVDGIFDELGVGRPLAVLAETVDFCKVAGQVIGITTEAGCIWAGAERHT